MIRTQTGTTLGHLQYFSGLSLVHIFPTVHTIHRSGHAVQDNVLMLTLLS